MPIQSGDRLTPGSLNVQVKSATSTSLLALSTTPADVAGTTLTFDVPYPGARWVATWAGDFDLTTAATLIATVSLVVDGVALSLPLAVWSPSNIAAGARETEGQSTSGTFNTAGTHTFKLQGQRTGTGGAVRLNSQHTALTVVIYP